MDTLHAILIAVIVFALFVLFTAYFLKSAIAICSGDKTEETLDKEGPCETSPMQIRTEAK